MKGEITMHGNREGIPLVFQSGSYYSRQIEWGEMDGGFWGFPAGFDSTLLFNMPTTKKSSRQGKPTIWNRVTYR
jgi:hypothetical protein